METAALLILLFLILAFVMIRNSNEEKKRINRYREFLKEDFGKYPPKEYKNGEFDLIPALYLREPEEDYIDDITWHDFGMDEVYKKIDQTRSAAGEEYLYWLLRSSNLSFEYRKNLDKDVSYFQREEEKRVNTQMHLWKLGRINKFSLYDYLNFLDTLGSRNNVNNYIGLSLFVISILLIFISTIPGVVCFIVMTCIQLATYLKEKAAVEPFIATFAYIMRMVETATAITAEKIETSNNDRMNDDLNKLKNFTKGYFRLFRLNSSSSDPMGVITEYFKMMTHADIIEFNKILNQVKENEDAIIELSKDVGYCDACISIASYRESLEYYCVPEFTDEKIFIIEEGYHPLIPNPVSSSFKQERGMLITGSNASGKSTFLRMTGVNALLAQTIMTCTAKKYRAPEFNIYSSMALQDNLIGGESYYIVEIKSLKRIIDAIDSSRRPVLCFVDEVLRGTNTVERIAASTQILMNISKKNVFCFAATHDIELTTLLAEHFDNYHFEEEVSDNDVHFSYKLLEGKAKTRNAIKLLSIIGFGDDIINHAEKQALDFMNTGEWHVC